MEINHLLKLIPTDNEQIISEFLSQYEEDIQEQIHSLWIDFSEKKKAETTEQDESNSEPVETAVSESPSETSELSVSSEPSDSTTSSDSSNSPETAPVEKSITEIQQEIKSGETPATALSAEEKQERIDNEKFAFEIKNHQITFQNGKVNQEYSVDFDFENLKISEIAEVFFEGLEDIGLRYIPEEKKITGKPTKAGDHKIEMQFKRKDWVKGKPLLSMEVLFIINPDPRELWSKNIPSEQDPKKIEYPKPDSDYKFVKVESKTEKSGFLGLSKKEIPRKNIVAASQRGRSHAIEGKPRDDDFALYFDEETEWYVMVVTDGAGSAPYSRSGSQIACQTAIEICSKQLAKNGISEVLDLAIREYYKEKSDKNRADLYNSLHSEVLAKAAWQAYTKINNEANEKGRKPKEYATTFLLSICKKFENGWFIGAFWVGDGGIGIYSKEPQELKVLGEPDGGEFAGQTRFLTMPEVFSDRVRTRFEIVEDFTALILMTDGVTDPKFETDANLNRIEKWHAFWNDLNGNNEDEAKVAFINENEQVADQLLKWLDFWSKGNHDDRTIAILF